MDGMVCFSKPRNCNINFLPKQGTGLNPLIPFISDIGREVLKQMIVYDPESRINIRRLVEHKYFDDLRYILKNKIKNLHFQVL